MAPPADPGQVAALVKRLTPLSQTERGELIRAQDWNVVVGAIVQLAQTLLATGAETSVPPHQHAGQVKAEWLEPGLKTLVERGPLADPDEVGRLRAAERDLVALRASVDGLRAEITELRVRLGEFSGRDVTRAGQMQSVALKLAAVDAVRDDVGVVRTSLAAVQESVNVAITVGQKLTVDGAAVDMPAVVGRIAALEGFRGGLTSPTGQPLDLAAIDDRIAAKTGTLVSHDDLGTILDQRPVVVPPDQLQAIQDNVTAAVKTDVTVTMNQLADSVRTDTQQRLAGVDALVARSVNDALPALGETVLTKVRPETTAAVQAAVTDLQGLVERRVGETQAAVQGQVGQQLNALRTELNGNLRDQLQREVSATLGPLQQRVDDLGRRLDETNVLVTRNADTLGGLGQRVEAVAVADATARDQLKADLSNQLRTQVETQVKQAVEVRNVPGGLPITRPPG